MSRKQTRRRDHERVLYYWAREFSSSLTAGESYSALPRTIVISIIDFGLFDCEEFSSFFQPLETARHTLLSDKMGFRFFELPKLPNEISDNDSLLLWLSLFKANTEEELERIRKMRVPEMEQAISAYYTITASPESREKSGSALKPATTRLKPSKTQSEKVCREAYKRAYLSAV